jgi:acyl-CoA synthetase (AMP-forming)/AMP-acid ligase II
VDQMQSGLQSRTIPEWWSEIVDAFGSRELVRHNGASATYAEIDSRAADLARGLLAQGVGKGTRIGLMLPNGADWIAGFLAITRVGGVAVTLSTLFAPQELAYALRHAGVAILLSTARYLRRDFRRQGRPTAAERQ